MAMALLREDTRSCEVGTALYDWGNVCPRDAHGVHHCVLPGGHDAGPAPLHEITGQPVERYHVCECGTKREVGRPANRRD
jgi:hypothetical protein